MPLKDSITTATDKGYTFSTPVVLRSWGNDGQITAKVGYVIKHPEQKRVVLEKIWRTKGGVFDREKFIIRDAQDWIAIKATVERLWPQLTDASTEQEIHNAIDKLAKETQLLDILTEYPELLNQIPETVDILSLPMEQKDALMSLLKAGGVVAGKVIHQLAKQPIRDLEHFVKLLDGLKLSTINALITHINSRLAFIDIFEDRIHDDASYERRGADSIHNLLKANLWMLDRNYSILHDDTTLKRIIEEQWRKSPADDSELAKRPDFLCLTDAEDDEESQNRIIIIEIKRPSIKLTFEHINQIMHYRTILQGYSGKTIGEFKCYIISREISDDLKVNNLSKSGFTVMTYTDFISKARRFYAEYSKIIECERYAL